MVLFSEMMLLYQPQLLEKLQVPVDRGQANPRMLVPCPTIQLIGIKMPPTHLNKIEEQGALSCYSLARGIQYLPGAHLLSDPTSHVSIPILSGRVRPSYRPRRSIASLRVYYSANANHLQIRHRVLLKKCRGPALLQLAQVGRRGRFSECDISAASVIARMAWR